VQYRVLLYRVRGISARALPRRYKKRLATLTMVFKLIQEAQRTWRKLDGSKQMEFVHTGRRFVDGVLQEEAVA
jgi:hypothetical protein